MFHSFINLVILGEDETGLFVSLIPCKHTTDSLAEDRPADIPAHLEFESPARKPVFALTCAS